MTHPSTSEPVTRLQELAWITAYSYYLERICHRWYYRIDKLISFLLLLSGMAVVGDLLPAAVLGVGVAVLTAWQLVYAPAEQAGKSRQAMMAYGELLNNFSVYTETDINQKINALTADDTAAPRIFERIAVNAACAKLGVAPQFDLNRLERWVARVCG